MPAEEELEKPLGRGKIGVRLQWVGDMLKRFQIWLFQRLLGGGEFYGMRVLNKNTC